MSALARDRDGLGLVGREEAESLLDASSLALRVWNEHRESAGLPRWEVVGLEVLERTVFLSRGMEYHVIVDLHDVTPLPF